MSKMDELREAQCQGCAYLESELLRVRSARWATANQIGFSMLLSFALGLSMGIVLVGITERVMN